MSGDMQVVELTGDDLDRLLDALGRLSGGYDVASLKFGIDPIDQALKVKVDNGSWSPPMGELL